MSDSWRRIAAEQRDLRAQAEHRASFELAVDRYRRAVRRHMVSTWIYGLLWATAACAAAWWILS